VTVDSLRAFLQARVAAGRKRATLDLNVATLRMVHRLADLPWPLDTLQGELMWARHPSLDLEPPTSERGSLDRPDRAYRGPGLIRLCPSTLVMPP
jgi:hypothetical protein